MSDNPFDPYARRRVGKPMKYGPGYRFGQLTILARDGNRVICVCDCGDVIDCTMPALTQGKKIDCGHRAIERDMRDKEEGSQRGEMLYWTWQQMMARCEHPQNPNYKNYGGRGIKVCERWRTFENFRDDLGRRPEGMTLDRINNDGNYEPPNVRWATKQEQMENTRPRIIVDKE